MRRGASQLLSPHTVTRYPEPVTRISASTALVALVPLVVAAIHLGPAPARADEYVLVLAVEAADEGDAALAMMADSMLRDALVEMPDVHLIDWTPTRATVASTCQTASMDATCLEVVAARYAADFIIVPTVGRQAQGPDVLRHIEARIYDAEARTFGDGATAAFDNDTDPEVALALLEVLMSDDEISEDDADIEDVDASEGRTIAAYATARLGHALGDARHLPGTMRARTTSLVPGPSPCSTVGALSDPTTRALCEQEHATANTRVLVIDGAGPLGHAPIARASEEVDAVGHGDRIDRMLERVRLNGRFSRSGVRVGAKIAF